MILQIETIAAGTDRVRLTVKSLINQWSDSFTIYKRYEAHKLDAIRAYQIRTYMKRYFKGRCTAFVKAGQKDTAKYKAMYSFLHHLSTDYPAGGPRAFFDWMIRRADFIRSTLPQAENKSHERIEQILLVCKEHA